MDFAIKPSSIHLWSDFDQYNPTLPCEGNLFFKNLLFCEFS
jgi:hypothetical protein